MSKIFIEMDGKRFPVTEIPGQLLVDGREFHFRVRPISLNGVKFPPNTLIKEVEPPPNDNHPPKAKKMEWEDATTYHPYYNDVPPMLDCLG